MTDDRYIFDVTEVRKVTDGDTFVLQLELPSYFYRTDRALLLIRLDYYDCPEKSRGSAFERAEAKHAQMVADAWLQSGRRLRCQTRKPAPDRPPVGDGGFGRWLGDLWDAETGEKLGAHLRSIGLASRWPTRWRDEFDQGAAA